MTLKGKIVPVTIVRRYGYEYHLVEISRADRCELPMPCFMGQPGMALHSFKKIDRETKFLKKRKKKQKNYDL
jgi:hypothetical protein